MNEAFDPKKLTLVEEEKPGFVKSDLESIYSTRSWEDMDKTREQALTDYMAGVTEQITPATSQPDLSTIDHTKLKGNPYDTQQEVLSRLNLLDENFNPTETYTEYINQGGTPVPGYESDHATLLLLDRVQDKQQQLQEGQITEDQMLWDLYATDILETQGYKIRSVGWWQSKFSNNDFTNPLTNRYLQQTVLQSAREYHNTLLAQQYTKNKTVADSRISTLLNKGDLSNDDVKTLFPELAKAIEETQKETDYMSFITSGQVQANQRIYEAEDGSRYYLHTDGELYKLSNEESGPKVATFTQDQDGNYTSISLNGSDIIDLAQSFKSGAASIVTGFAKLGGFLWGATIGAINEGSFVDGIGETMAAMDSYFNDDLNWLTDSRYIDMDGFQVGDAKDWGMFISSTLGAMTAGAITGGVAGKVVGWGETLSAAGHPIAGRVVSFGATLYQRSTGLYKGVGDPFATGPVTGTLAHVLGNGWLPTLNNMKTVGVYMTKDFMNTTSSLYNQRIQMQLADYQNDPESYDPDKYATSKEMFQQAAKVTIINGLISSVLAGGMDDNQTQRWAAILSGTGKHTTVELGPLSQHLLKYSIAYNTVGDFLDNFLTNWTTSQVKLDKDGKVDGFELFNGEDWNILSAEGARTLVQAAIMTLPTFQKQLQRRDVAAEQAVNIHRAYLNKLVEEQNKTSDPEQKQILETVRLNYLEDMQRGQLDNNGQPMANQSQADKILWALSKQHEYLANSDNTSIVSDIIDKTCSPIMVGIYKEVNALAEESYNNFLQNAKNLDSDLETKGIRGMLGNLIRNHFLNTYTQKKAALQYQGLLNARGVYDAKLNQIIDNFTERTINEYLTITDSKESTDIQENLSARLNLTAKKLEESKESFLSYKTLLRRNKKLKEADIISAAQKHADKLNNGDTSENALTAKEVLGNSKFFRIKNESTDRETFNAEKAALFVASNVLSDNFYKIDEYTYGMLALDNEISKMFTSDMYSKLSVGMNALGQSDPELKTAGINLMISAMWGDTATKYFREGNYDKAVAKDNVEALFQAAIENNVITKKDAAEFLMTLSESDNKMGRQLGNLFEKAVSTKSAEKMENLSDLEKYTLIYASVQQLNNKETKRFSGKTLGAEVILQQGYDDITFEVIKDIGMVNDEGIRKWYNEAVEQKWKGQTFPLVTDSLIRGLTQVVGDDTIKTKSDLKARMLEGLAPGANKAEVEAAFKVVMDTIDTLNKFESVKYKGNVVAIDLSEWSNEQYRKMIADIQNTSIQDLEGRKRKETIYEMPEYSAEQLLKYREKSEANKQLYTIEVTESNLDKFKSLYKMLKDASVIASYTKEPQNIEDVKKMLAQVSDDKLIRFKNTTEQDSGIISKEEAKIIKQKLKTYQPKDLIDTVSVIDPETNKEVIYDYYTIIGSNIKINKISENTKKAMYIVPGSPIYINPVDPETIGTEKNGALAYVTYETNNTNKLGRAGGSVKSIQGATNVKGALADVNKDLALTMMVDSYIDFVVDNKDKLNIVVPKKSLIKLQDLGIISDDGFYESVDTMNDDYARLQLKSNVTKEAMQLYIESNKQPNLFKILPFVSESKADFSIPFLTPEGTKMSFVPDINGDNLTDYRGLYKILNMTFDYDQTNKIRTSLIESMFNNAKNGKFEFNPFSEYKQVLDTDALTDNGKIDLLEAYTQYRQGTLRSDIDDPYYTLALAYQDLNEKYVDNDNNDDSLLWLKHGSVLKRMIQAAEDGEQSINVGEIKNLYKESTNFEALPYSPDSVNYPDISTKSYFGSPYNLTNDTLMSKQILDSSIGADYKLVNQDGSYSTSLKDASIQEAYDYVKKNIEAIKQINVLDDPENILSYAWGDNSTNLRYYKPTGATSLWTILSAAEGSITIEDLDALTRIEADQYNAFFEQLGMKAGYGSKIKQKVDNLYDSLSKIMFGEKYNVIEINKEATVKQTPSYGASTTRNYQRNVFNKRNKGFKEAINATANDYIKDREQLPQITSQRLVDALADNASDFESSYIQNKRSDLDNFVSNLYNRFGEISTRDNADYKGQTIIDELSADINITKLAKAAQNTHNSFVENFKIDNKDVEDNLVDYASMVTERMTGSKYLPEYAKYSFLDLSTGKEFDNAVISNINGTRSTVDLVSTLFNRDTKDWIGKAYIEFEKKDTSGEGLTYSYKVLNNEQDVINLKNESLLGLLKQNEWKLDGDIENFAKSMTTQEQANFVNKIISNGITNRDKMTLLDNALGITNITNFQYRVVAQPYLTDLNKNTIRDVMGTDTSALHSTHPGIRKLANAIIFGIDYDGMDDEHKQAVDLVKAYYNAKYDEYQDANKYELDNYENMINSGKDLTKYQFEQYRKAYGITNDADSVPEAIKKYLIRNFDNPETLDYIFNHRRSLLERFDQYTNGYSDTYKTTLSDGEVADVSVKDLSDFLNKDLKTYNGNLKKIIAFDTEGSNKAKSTGNTADSIKDLFQISFITYERNEDGSLKQSQETFFIDHGGTDPKRFSTWVENQIDPSDSWYLRHEDYQDIVKAYASLTGTESNIKTEAEIADILNGRLSSSPDLLIAYNGDNYEFRVLKDVIDSDIKKLDAIKSVLKDEANTSIHIDQDSVYKRTFGDDHGDERHTADQDTRDMMDLFYEYVNSDNDISYDRSLLMRKIINLVPENYRDADHMNHILYQTEQLMNIDNPDISKLLNKFNDYTPTLDNIKQLQRSYNYLMNDARGNVFFKIREQLGYNPDSPYDKLVSDSTSKFNVINVLSTKMLETEGDPVKALDKLYYDYIKGNEENSSFYAFLKDIVNLDENTLTKLHIDQDLFNNEEVLKNKNYLIDQFKSGEDGFAKGKIDNISVEAASKYIDNRRFLPYVQNVEDIVLKNKDIYSPEDIEILKNLFSNGAVSISEDYDINNLSDYRKNYVRYSNPTAERILKEVKNIQDGNRGTSTFNGLYTMMNAIKPGKNEGFFEITNPFGDEKLVPLDNVEAGDMVITKKALEKLLNVYDVDDLKVEGSKDLYLLSITNPADNMNSLLPLRVRIIDGDENTIYFTPETQELLRNRDFDGDHTMTTILPSGMKPLAPLLHKYMFNTYTAYEDIANYLSSKYTSDLGNTEFQNAHYLKIASDKNVIKACEEFDSYLGSRMNKELNATQVTKYENRIRKAILNSPDFIKAKLFLLPDEEADLVNDVMKSIGMKEVFTGTGQPIRYINNPSLFNLDGNTKEMRKAMFARQTMTGSNILDSTIGWAQKSLSKQNFPDKTIQNPMTDLYTPSIYLTSGVEDLIDANIKTVDDYNNYIDTVINAIKKQVTTDKYTDADSYNKTLDSLKTEFKILGDIEPENLEKVLTSQAKLNTMRALWDLELHTQQDANINKDFLSALDKVSSDDSFNQKLEVSKKLDGLLSELSGSDYSLYSKKSNATPLADMLLEDAIDMRYYDPEDPLVNIKDDISNGANYANIFITKGLLDSRDSIAMTDNTGLVTAKFGILPDNIEYKNLKKNKLYEAGKDIIGTKKDGTPYYAPYNFYVNDVQNGRYIINTQDTIKGKKLTGQGFFKGLVSQDVLHLDNPNIDLVVDLKNATKKFDKYSHGFNFAKAWQDAKEVTYTINGKDYTGYIIKKVPVNIIGDDTTYHQKLDITDPNNVRNFEVMTSQGNLGLLGIGMYGNTVLKKLDDNTYELDFSQVSKHLRDNDKPHDVNWGDAGTKIMYLRSAALARALGEEKFLGLINEYSPDSFNSIDDYLNDLRSSREKINSEASLNEQNAMIRALGKDNFRKLYNTSDLTKYLFGRSIHEKLNPWEPSVFKDDFYKDVPVAISKNSGKYQLMKYAKKTPGSYISPSARDVNDRALIQGSYLHVPFDEFYSGVFHRSLDQKDIIDAIIKGKLGYTKTFKNSAMISNDFTPVELSMGTKINDVLNKNIIATGEKTAIEGDSDIFIPRDNQYGIFQRGSNTGDVFSGTEDPYQPTFNTLISDAESTGHVLSHADKWTRLSYMLSNAFDPAKNSLSKLATLKGDDFVEMHNYIPQFINKKYGDKSVLNYMAVGDNREVDFNNIQKAVNEGTKGYMLRKDLADTIDKHEFTSEDVKNFRKSGILSEHKQDTANLREMGKKQKEAYSKLIAALNSKGSKAFDSDIKFTWDVSNDTTPWKDWAWSRSGIKVDTEDKLAVDIGIKNRYAQSQWLQEQYMGELNSLKTAVAKTNPTEFEDFAKYKWLNAAQQFDPEGYELRSKYMGNLDTMETLKANYEAYVKKNPEVVKQYETYVDNIINFAKQTSDLRNEPFDSYYVFFAPYISKNKEERYGTVLSNIKTMMSINKYDPVSKRNALEQNMMFNFFEGSERLIRDLSEAYAAENISDALLGKYTDKALIDNKPIVEAAYNFINNEEVMNDLKVYKSFDEGITNEVLNVLSLYTDIDVQRLKKNSKNQGDLLTQAYNVSTYRVQELLQEYEDLTGEVDPELTSIYRLAKEPGATNESTRLLAEELSNAMWAEIVIGQRVLECSPAMQKNFSSFLMNAEKDGYVLVNRYGQKINKNSYVSPTSSNTMSNLKTNVEIAMNSGSEAQWTQYLLEKALSGEIYLAKQDLADSLEKHVWTNKVSNRMVSTLKKISSRSASFQMALPAKMLGRLIRFTGFDYAMGAVGNYETIPNISRAAKELSAALQSGGKNISEDLKDYLIREGQPTYGRDAKSKDPINYTEDTGNTIISKVTDLMTRPLDFQNHLGRYAIYLTAKDGFDSDNPWYGPLYFNHEAIDKIKDNRDKAMYVMDYMLGSPGGFPELSKKTAGWMMYSTFPMNLTRTMGAYGMSMAKLFQEGVTQENANQWFNTIIMPSLGTVGIAALSNAIISAICEQYGVDEETEEEWKKEGVSLDPLGTLIGGTPSVVYDSVNPAYNLKEMFINPFTNEYNDTLPKKGYGWFKANVLSKLNPAIKAPIEVITGKDLWGNNAEGYQSADSLFDKTKKHQYTTLENGMKKVLGYFVGSEVADSIIDERKLQQTEGNENPSLNSYLWKGLVRGVSSDLGNQKSWKKNTSNYYSFITDMKTFKKTYSYAEGTGNASNAYGYNYLDIDEMTDAEKLYYNRNYSNMYGVFDDDDYNRVSSTLKKYINQHRDSSTIYSYIVKEYNENHVSEATMRAALNNNSILRKINQLKTGNTYIEYLRSLTADEKMRLQSAIEYENEYYPMLQYLFPDNVSSKKVYIPPYRKDYLGSSGTPGSSRPYTPKNRYYPGRYYPSTYKFNKKTSNYNWDWRRVKVNVSPQMAIWNQDKNLTQYDTGMSKKNDPRWLRSRDYTSRVYNI